MGMYHFNKYNEQWAWAQNGMKAFYIMQSKFNGQSNDDADDDCV